MQFSFIFIQISISLTRLIKHIMMPIKKNLLTCLILICVLSGASAQSVPDSTIKKIDDFFKYWDKNNSPGFAVGIVRNDSLIFAKGYGMANLEL